MNSSKQLPTWFLALTGLIFLMNLFVFGIMTLVSPFIAFPGAGEGAIFPIQFLAVRHIAFSLPLLFGLIRRDVKVLTVMFSIFFVMSSLDVALLGLYGYDIPVLGLIPAIDALPTVGRVLVGIGTFTIPMGAALFELSHHWGNELVTGMQKTRQATAN